MEFDNNNGNVKYNNCGEYKIETIQNSIVYTKESESHLPRLYYLVSWKEYPKEENTWESALAVQHLKELIRFFHKDYLDKPTITSLAIDIVPPMARLTVKFPTKQKQGQLAKNTTKYVKK